MNEDLETENSQTTEEEETSEIEEETSVEEQETLETPDEPEGDKQTDQLYARLKKAEAKSKELEKKLKVANAGGSEVDIADLAEKMAALSGLDAVEKQRALQEAKIQDVPLGDARKSRDFKLWRSAYRAELEKAKSPKPSTKQTLSEAEESYGEIGNWSDDKFEKEAVEGLKIFDPKTGKVNKVNLLDRGLQERLRKQHREG